MYPSDFNAAEAVYAPVEDGLVLGVPPLVVFLVVLLILAIAAAAYMMGRRASKQSGGTEADKAPGEIYEVVLRYATAARSASSNELKQKAEVLDRKIEEYLGPVILIGKDLGGLIKALKQAGEGKVEEPAKPDPKKDPEPQTKVCSCGGSKATQGCRCGHAKAVAIQPLSIHQIYIGGSPVVPAAGGCAPETSCAAETPPPKTDKVEDKPAPKTVKRDMTHQEQVDALDKAVRAFNDHWLNRDKRIQELKAAQSALNRRPPSSELPPSTVLNVWSPTVSKPEKTA